jgi:hypothetical protein
MRVCMKIPALAKRRSTEKSRSLDSVATATSLGMTRTGTHQERLGAAVRPALLAVIQSSLASHMGFPHGNF